MSVFITHIFLFQFRNSIAQFSLSTDPETVMYDAIKGTDPDHQGWLYFTNRLSQSNVHRYTEYGQHYFDTLTDRTETAGYFGNLQLPVPLDRQTGFTFHISLQLLEEYHTTGNRAGFSVIILSSDALGIELAFWEDEIWVYDEQFQKAERFSTNTTEQIRRYSVEISGVEFKIFIDENFAFKGLVRDYSNFPFSDDFPNIYTTPNFIFFGNNTSRASSKTAISLISVQTPAVHSTRLFQNAPNPFQNLTTISFYLDSAGPARLDLFDLTGRHVASLLNNQLDAGRHSVDFDAAQISAGLYYYRLIANGRVYTKKLIVAR